MKNNILSINEYRNNPEFYFTKGLRLANKNNLGEAYRSLTKALELEPDNSEYKFNMACFLSELQRPKEANRIFQDILINFAPTMYDCFFGLGCNSFEVGDNEKAAEHFDKYLYFDADGEFSYEISEMAFYLKLYSETSHDNRFLKTSDANYKKAQKQLKEDNTHNAINYLYKSIISNPLNIEARNQLTLALMQKQHYIRARYINASVKNINAEDIWGNCLNIYLLFNSKKLSKLNKVLEMLPYRPVKSRDDLLCAATAFVLFNRREELKKFIEMHIVDYSDSLVYSILLFSYVITDNYQKVDEISEVLNNFSIENSNMRNWITSVKAFCTSRNAGDNLTEYYEKLFSIYNEPLNFKYDPGTYSRLLENNKIKKARLPGKYAPIIEGALKKREIMYSKLYHKEIIGMLANCIKGSKGNIEPCNGSYEMYSAALEYSYCKLFHIAMDKEELLLKYNITADLFNLALSRLGCNYINS